MGNLLLENIEILVDVSGFRKDLVVGVNITSSIDTIMSATISLVPSSGAQVGPSRLYSINQLGNFKASEAIGKDITIEWKHRKGKTLLFKGFVTGSGWSKSTGQVSYELRCQAGPLALFQTSLGGRGICNWCSECDHEEELYLEEQLLKGDFSSPRELLKVMANAVLKAQQGVIERFPKSITVVNEIITAAIEEAIVDIDALKEPSILNRFWGIAGLLGGQIDEISVQMANMAVQHLGNTWMGFFSQILGNIDVHWTATKFGNLILPNLSFMAVPSFNVVFPCLMQACSANTDLFSAPAIMLMGFDKYPVTDSEVLRDALFEGQYITYPTSANKDEIIQPKFSANTFRVINPPAFSEFFYRGVFDKDTAKQWEGKNLAQTVDQGETSKQIFADATEKFKLWGENWLKWKFYTDRYSRNSGMAQLDLCPNVIPGFPGMIFDPSVDTFITGLVRAVSHSISQSNASTSMQLVNVIADKDQASTVYNAIENPIFVDIKSRVNEIANETTGLNPTVIEPTSSPETFLKYFDDPEAASNFMLRWENGS